MTIQNVADVVTGVLVVAVCGVGASVFTVLRDVAILKEQQQRRLENDKVRAERDIDIDHRLRAIEQDVAIVREILERDDRRVT